MKFTKTLHTFAAVYRVNRPSSRTSRFIGKFNFVENIFYICEFNNHFTNLSEKNPSFFYPQVFVAVVTKCGTAVICGYQIGLLIDPIFSR